MNKKLVALLLGDIMALYASLWLALLVRGPDFTDLVGPFSLIFFVWLLVFYIAGLYDLELNQDRLKFYSLLWKVLVINGLIAITIFYLGVGHLGITPKTILFLTLVFLFAIFIVWRDAFRSLLKKFPENVLVIGKAPTEVIEHPDYNITNVEGVSNFKKLIKHKNIQTVVIAGNPHLNPATTAELFNCLPLRFMDLASFYEQAFKKIPINKISRVWFLENVSEKRVYGIFKRLADIVLASLGLVITLPFWPLIALAIKLDSPGPVFYSQIRIGKNNQKFTLWKFRTMKENNGAKWTEQNDLRITRIGSFLRKTRLDEIPQFINIFKGEISLVGPRAEAKELVEDYQSKISFYPIRHLIKPGVTGWAQTKFPHGTRPEDTKKKLEHDLYYIKNRSLALDLGIVLRTIKTIISRAGN